MKRTPLKRSSRPMKRSHFRQRTAKQKPRPAPLRRTAIPKTSARKRKGANQQAVTEFKHETNHCQACGVEQHWLGLQFHHIIKTGRVDDRRNGLLVCGYCHLRMELQWIVVEGKRLGPIPLEEVLWLKLHRDPQNYSRKYLQSIYPRKLPRAKKPDWHV